MLTILILSVWLVPAIVLGSKASRKWYASEFKRHLKGKEGHNKKAKAGYHYCYSFEPCYPDKPSRFKAVGFGLVHGLLWPWFKGHSLVAKLFKSLGNASFGDLEDKVKEELKAERQEQKQNYLAKFQEDLISLAFDRNLATTPIEVILYNSRLDSLLTRIKAYGDVLEKSDIEALDNQYRI